MTGEVVMETRIEERAAMYTERAESIVKDKFRREIVWFNSTPEKVVTAQIGMA